MREPSVRTERKALSSLGPVAAFLACCLGCAAPPPRALVWVDAPEPLAGASTERGLFVLDGSVLDLPPVRVRQWVGADLLQDEAEVVVRDGAAALLAPKTARFDFTSLARAPLGAEEEAFVLIEEADPEHRPRLLPARRAAGGAFGDLLQLSSPFAPPAERIAARYPGAPVLARRKGAYEVVGLLNGLVARPEGSAGDALLFVGWERLAALASRSERFFDRKIRPKRIDLEYGEKSDAPGTSSASP